MPVTAPRLIESELAGSRMRASRLIDEGYASGGKLDTGKFNATVTQLARKHFS
jgi:hypothetical protein